MTSILLETVVSMSAAARSLPKLRAGKNIHPSTLWRWARNGVNTPAGKIRLETASLAGRVVTSSEALARFLACVADAKAGNQVATSTISPPDNSPDHGHAVTELDKLGI